jgi:hypothetical protein
LTLQELWPTTAVDQDGNTVHALRVTAAEVEPGVHRWSVNAWAICAKPPPGYQRVLSAPTDDDAAPVKTNTAACPAGKRLLGTGASVNDFLSDPAFAEVGLQVARADVLGVLTRAQARTDADGYSGRWTLRAAAICAYEPIGYEIADGTSSKRGSELIKSAFARRWQKCGDRPRCGDHQHRPRQCHAGDDRYHISAIRRSRVELASRAALGLDPGPSDLRRAGTGYRLVECRR